MSMEKSKYELLKCPELRMLINKNHFYTKKGVALNTATKKILVSYLDEHGETAKTINESEISPPSGNIHSTSEMPALQEAISRASGTSAKASIPSRTIARRNSIPDLSTILVNQRFDLQPPRIKDFKPNTAKLEKIRESLPKPECEQEVQLDADETADLDDEDVEVLKGIVGDEVHEKPAYEVNEMAEFKIQAYVRLYPNLKPIVSSPDFASSQEKLAYLESYLNSSRFNVNLVNGIFGITTAIERNDFVGQYVKLRGYTKTLAQRRTELETMIEELKIKYMDEIGELLTLPIEARIALFFAQTALDTHLINAQRESIQS